MGYPRAAGALGRCLGRGKRGWEFRGQGRFSASLGHASCRSTPADYRRDGSPAARILLAIEDITSRKQIEDEVLRSDEDARRFAYAAAHDLRAPLNTAMMLLQVLSEKTAAKLEEDERQALSLATTNLQRAATP